MTGDDLRRVQDTFLEGAKHIIQKHDRLHPVGFVVTRHDHVSKLDAAGWEAELLPGCVRDKQDDRIATIILDLLMDPRRLYHAVLRVFPQTRDILPRMIELAEGVGVDDPYKRVMRPFLRATQLDEKDIMAAVMRQVCETVDAFACIMQSEAWLRTVGQDEDPSQIADDLGSDAESVEVIVSTMETRSFVRMLSVPVHREPATSADQRDKGKVTGFGEHAEGIHGDGDDNVLEGRLVRFLKPVEAA